MAFLNQAQIFEIMDAQDYVEAFPYRWGTIKRYHVVRDDIDYVVDVPIHVTEGVQDEEFELQKAKKTTKMVDFWEPI